MSKKIKIGDKSYVKDGNNFVEESNYKNYMRKKDTATKIGGALSKAQNVAPKFQEHVQKD
tara:strand:+ start:173 stop:352 length:180 start_codon:yes stop_codon:yes gene_type:complete